MDAVDTQMNRESGEAHQQDLNTALRKRKRGISTPAENNSVVKEEAVDKENNPVQVSQLLKDALEVLQSYDLSSSILNHPFIARNSEEPDNKRARLENDSNETSIRSRVESGSYASIRDLFADIEDVSSSLLSHASAKDNLPNGYRSSSATESPNLDIRVAAFKKQACEVLLPELMRLPSASRVALTEPSQIQRLTRNDKAALTLFGHAPNSSQPRQVFSSLQQPLVVGVGQAKVGSSVEIYNSVRDAALPNGITLTNVAPFNPPKLSASKKKLVTFADAFAAPSTLPSLQPPPPSKHTTRSSTITFYKPDDLFKSTLVQTAGQQRENYKYAKVKSGDWIRYGSSSAAVPPQSPQARRRAIDEDEDEEMAKTIALFRRSYSGFGPTTDNSHSIVPEDVRDRIWWRKTGEQRFNSIFFPVVQDESPMSDEDVFMNDENQERLFEEAVDEWKPEPLPPSFKDVDDDEIAAAERTIDDILKDISELLETLNSYQRIRNLSSISRGSLGQSTATSTGNPATPLAQEIDVYDMLKGSLASMIETLPPHAVAKLDGDQLKGLNISTKILVENKDFRGTMEEDDYTLRMRETLSAPTSRTPSVSASVRPTNYPSGSTPSQYGQRPSYLAQPSTTRTQSFQAPLNYPGRPMSSANPYASGTPQPYLNRTPSTSQRPTIPPQPYSQGGSPFGQSGPSYSSQRLANGYGSSATQAPYRQPSQPGYQQRAQDSAAYNTALDARSASPQKSPYTPQQQNAYAASSNSATQPRYFQGQTHHPSQYGQYPPSKTPGPPVNHVQSPPRLEQMMTAAERAIIGDPVRPTMKSSPQPVSPEPTPSVNGQYTQSVGRTPTPFGGQQNGTPSVPVAGGH